MKLCKDCEYAKKIIENKRDKLQCMCKDSYYYGKTFGMTAHACR